jgi:hypothetical protein
MSLEQQMLYDHTSKVHKLLLSGLPERPVAAQIEIAVVRELTTFWF